MASQKGNSLEANNKPVFPLRRYIYFGSHRDYYAYGNTPAEDFLESCSERKPSILSLGCGDIRSCFYTLWKHFGVPDSPNRYDGIHFTLNDCSAAVLARNVVFLHLTVHLPKDGTSQRSWLSGMWAVWYCHELGQDHMKMLSDSLKDLVRFSGSLEKWNCKENPLKDFVHFASSGCLSSIAQVWKMWANEDVEVNSVKLMQESRKQHLSKHINDMALYCSRYSEINTHVYGKETDRRRLGFQASEVKSYFISGNCFAEIVLDLSPPAHTKVNLTLYERGDGIYTMHYGAMPYSGYHQSIEFSSKVFGTARKKPCDVEVPSLHFKDKPFLANSVQQFVMWVQSASRVFENMPDSVNFVFSNQDALAFCYEMKSSNENLGNSVDPGLVFDSIYTSNLLDHTGLPNLVLPCIPLLKPNGFLYTSSLDCKNCTCFSTMEEFLKLCFGFDCSLLPVILGIRCINHEGKNCSSSVTVQPFPPDVSNEQTNLPHFRRLVWEKLPNIQPLHISQLPQIESDNITDALVNLIGSCAFSFLNHGVGHSTAVVSPNSIETALLMLQYFAARLSKNIVLDPTFWKPLCTELKHVVGPFILTLQTQLLLHNIHAHLVITEDDCPLCNQEELEDKIGLYSVKFSVEHIPSYQKRPLFYALVYKHPSYKNARNLLRESLTGEGVHIFDSFDGTVTNDTLELKFFAPLQLASPEYKLTMVFGLPKSYELTTVLNMSMTDAHLLPDKYNFHKPSLPPADCVSQKNDEFGSVISHLCDGYKAETVLSLSSATQAELTTSQLRNEKVSSFEVKFLCGSLCFLLHHNYPIDHDKVIFEHSEERNTLRVTCQRKEYGFDDEKVHFIVNPDHQLAIPSMKQRSMISIIKSQSTMQFMQDEFAQFRTTPFDDLPPLMRVKVTILRLFEQSSSCHYFQIKNIEKSSLVLIVVTTTLFDYQFKTPAIDLTFNVTEACDTVTKSWGRLIRSAGGKQSIFKFNDAQFMLLKRTLAYFADRTNGKPKPGSDFSQFFASASFSRAVVYFLLNDPDKYTGNSNYDFPYTVGGAYCGWPLCCKFSFTMKKCKRCKVMHYCSKECQINHWKEHRLSCNESPRMPSSASAGPPSSMGLFSTKTVLKEQSESSANKHI